MSITRLTGYNHKGENDIIEDRELGEFPCKECATEFLDRAAVKLTMGSSILGSDFPFKLAGVRIVPVLVDKKGRVCCQSDCPLNGTLNERCTKCGGMEV